MNKKSDVNPKFKDIPLNGVINQIHGIIFKLITCEELYAEFYSTNMVERCLSNWKGVCQTEKNNCIKQISKYES